MICKKHNKKNLDCWYDCSECSIEYCEHLDTIILEIDIISKTINRPITKVLDDLIGQINYKYDYSLDLLEKPKTIPHKCSPSFCTNCDDLPF